MIQFKTILLEYSKNIFYHGSNIPDIIEFNVDETKFSLLGPGIYMYKKVESAKMYGNYIYTIDTSNLKIAPENMLLNPQQRKEILNNFNIQYDNEKQLPSGISNSDWWFLNAYDYFGLNRKTVVIFMKEYITNKLHFDGMLFTYPNGGLVCCVWNYKKIKIINIIKT